MPPGPWLLVLLRDYPLQAQEIVGDYNFVASGAPDDPAGSVGIIVHPEWGIGEQFRNPNLPRCIALELRNGRHRVLVCSVYLPPEASKRPSLTPRVGEAESTAVTRERYLLATSITAQIREWIQPYEAFFVCVTSTILSPPTNAHPSLSWWKSHRLSIYSARWGLSLQPERMATGGLTTCSFPKPTVAQRVGVAASMVASGQITTPSTSTFHCRTRGR